MLKRLTARFSVIIPTLNEEETLHDCLSLLGETNSDLEIIVADGGSTDRTVQIAEEHKAKVCHSERGRGRQCNAGAALASGDIILFLHADTTVPPDVFIELEAIFRNDRVKIGTFFVSFDIDHWLLDFFRLLSHLDPGLFRFGDQCIVMRRSLFNSLQGFPEYRLFEDIGLIQKARKVTRIYRFPMTVNTSARRFRQNGVIRQQLRNVYYTLQYFMGVSPEKLATKYERGNRRLDQTSLIIFLRFPRPGSVKTRLINSLGEKTATDLYRLCADNVLCESSKLPRNIQRHIFYTGTNDEAEVTRWAGQQFSFASQIEGNLGKRIEHAFRTVFRDNARKAIILASDVPDVSAELINDALSSLDHYDIIIGPTYDGGYYLLGMKKLHEQLFRDISWSTEAVYRQTTRIAKNLGLRIYTLPSLVDIDTEEDLNRWMHTVKKDDHPLLRYMKNINYEVMT